MIKHGKISLQLRTVIDLCSAVDFGNAKLIANTVCRGESTRVSLSCCHNRCPWERPVPGNNLEVPRKSPGVSPSPSLGCAKRVLMNWTTSSLVITSQMPSHAKTTNSQSSSMVNCCTSGNATNSKSFHAKVQSKAGTLVSHYYQSQSVPAVVYDRFV